MPALKIALARWRAAACRGRMAAMCNLYYFTKGQAEIPELTRAIVDWTDNF